MRQILACIHAFVLSFEVTWQVLRLLLWMLAPVIVLCAAAAFGQQVALYRVCIPEGGGSYSCGSGTGISNHAIITNSHVVGHKASGQPAEVSDHDGHRFDGVVIAAKPSIDMAVVWVAAGIPKYAALAASGPRPGEPVTMAGWTTGIRQARCLDSRLYMDQSYRVPVLQTSAATQPGDSGGGVYNAAGELCAVHWGASEGTAKAVSVEQFAAWLPVLEQQCGPLGCRRGGGGWGIGLGGGVAIGGGRPVYDGPPQPTRPVQPLAPQQPSRSIDGMATEIAALREAVKQINERLTSDPIVGKDGRDGQDTDPEQLEKITGILEAQQKRLDELAAETSQPSTLNSQLSQDLRELSARLAALEAAVYERGTTTYRLRRVPVAK